MATNAEAHAVTDKFCGIATGEPWRSAAPEGRAVMIVTWAIGRGDRHISCVGKISRRLATAMSVWVFWQQGPNNYLDMLDALLAADATV